MSDSKVFMFPETESNNGLMSLIAPLLTQRGVDPNVLLAMNRNNGFGGDGGWFMWIIFLFFLMGWGGNGWNNGFGGNRGFSDLGNMINNDTGRELLMSAIQGNGSAINQLASTLNCAVGDIQTAINGVMSQVQSVGNTVGLSAQQIINAVQAGNCTIASKIADCCCENRLAICQQTNTLQNAINTVSVGQERGFSSVAFETQKQTCSIEKAISNSTEQILAGQRAAELRDMQNKIDALRESNSQKDVIINNSQQTAMVNQMIQSATQPIVGAIANLQADVNCVKCHLPETVTLPFSCATAVPTNVLYNASGYGYGCGCGNSLWG